MPTVRLMNALILVLALSLPAGLDAAVDRVERAGSGGVLLVRAHGKVYRRAWGPGVKPEQLYDIGSITKVFTAAAVLKTLPPELTVGDVFPSAPPDKAALTVEQLLTHRSGLPDSLGLDETLVKRDFFLEKLWKAPLEKPQYSNAAYSLLAAMLEVRTGKPYESFIRRPIAYERSGDRAIGTLRGMRWGSTADYFGPDGRPSWYLLGNGGLMASIDELDRWFAELWAEDSPASRAIRERLTRKDKWGRTIVFSSGSNLIFSSHYEWWPDDGVVFILFTSDSEWPKEKLLPELRPAIVELAGRP
jgi:CubicO group peptidase (beta-lactamase class C family)